MPRWSRPRALTAPGAAPTSPPSAARPLGAARGGMRGSPSEPRATARLQARYVRARAGRARTRRTRARSARRSGRARWPRRSPRSRGGRRDAHGVPPCASHRLRPTRRPRSARPARRGRVCDPSGPPNAAASQRMCARWRRAPRTIRSARSPASSLRGSRSIHSGARCVWSTCCGQTGPVCASIGASRAQTKSSTAGDVSSSSTFGRRLPSAERSTGSSQASSRVRSRSPSGASADPPQRGPSAPAATKSRARLAAVAVASWHARSVSPHVTSPRRASSAIRTCDSAAARPSSRASSDPADVIRDPGGRVAEARVREPLAAGRGAQRHHAVGLRDVDVRGGHDGVQQRLRRAGARGRADATARERRRLRIVVQLAVAHRRRGSASSRRPASSPAPPEPESCSASLPPPTAPTPATHSTSPPRRRDTFAEVVVRRPAPAVSASAASRRARRTSRPSASAGTSADWSTLSTQSTVRSPRRAVHRDFPAPALDEIHHPVRRNAPEWLNVTELHERRPRPRAAGAADRGRHDARLRAGPRRRADAAARGRAGADRRALRRARRARRGAPRARALPHARASTPRRTARSATCRAGAASSAC